MMVDNNIDSNEVKFYTEIKKNLHILFLYNNKIILSFIKRILKVQYFKIIICHLQAAVQVESNDNIRISAIRTIL